MGDWVLHLYPPVLNKSNLNVRNFGPFLVIGNPGVATNCIQQSPQASPVVVHVDQLKRYYLAKPLEKWRTVEKLQTNAKSISY